jgi:hypothetical protein
MSLQDCEMRVLALAVTGTADPKTTREAMELLARSVEAQVFVRQVLRITRAIRALPLSFILNDKELRPWLDRLRATRPHWFIQDSFVQEGFQN